MFCQDAVQMNPVNDLNIVVNKIPPDRIQKLVGAFSSGGTKDDKGDFYPQSRGTRNSLLLIVLDFCFHTAATCL
jgi:hypothetical protein